MPQSTSLRHSLVALWPIVLIGLLMVLGFAGLGVWQVERLAWKNALVKAVETRSTGSPLDLDQADWAGIDAEAMQYQRVSVTGRFRPEVALAQAVTVAGSGFWVMAPLHLSDGRQLLVNRGFVAQDRRDALASPPDGAVTVTGLLRATEPDGGFLRSNDPQNGRWYSRDTLVIGQSMNIDDLPPFFVDADDTPGDDVLGGLTVLSFSNNHLVYALTWFALAAFVLGALVFVVRDRARH